MTARPRGHGLPRLLSRVAFAAYALALFTATHWPNLKVPGDVPRGDLWIHASVLAGWTALLLSGAFFGPALSPRNIARCIPLAIAYAGFDELTQAIPIIHRVAAWDDFGADCLGVLLAGVVALILSRRQSARATTAADAAPLA